VANRRERGLGIVPRAAIRSRRSSPLNGRANTMKRVSRHLIPAAAITICVIAATAVRAQDEDQGNEANRYVVTNLVSDLSGQAKVPDPHLKNSWGVAFTPGASQVWIPDNATG